MFSFASRRALFRRAPSTIKSSHPKGSIRHNGDVSEAQKLRVQSKIDRQNRIAGTSKSNFKVTKPLAGFIALVGVAGYSIYDIRKNKDGALGTIYYGSALNDVVSYCYDVTIGRFNQIFTPEDKLLPTWPTDPCYGGPPEGSPCPPLLVIDLEKTLIGSEYNSQFGWRHVKRPGLDQFIDRLSQYYEIVIFSENDIGAVQEILMAIDPSGKTHKLGNTAAESRDGVMIKRLDLMNRDVSRIILIDDNPDAYQLCERNTLSVQPFDLNNTADTVLFDLIPLLQAFVHDGVVDFRDTIDDLGTHEAEEACIEYRMRVSDRKAREEKKRNRGLGGVVRSTLRGPAIDLDPDEIRSKVLSVSQLVGSAPEGGVSDEPSSSTGKNQSFTGPNGTEINIGKSSEKVAHRKKKGGFFEWLDEAEQQKQEVEMRKMEKMNEIYGKRLAEKAMQERKEQEERMQAE
mmetsp:Transcript_15661/g.14997  ORF Transcript_15661/g.14997 Transcript_15661/m.14997 type:complete len:457 (-) Transcript_15661:220-1590(-)